MVMTDELRNTLIEIRNMAKSVKERSYSEKIVRDMDRIIDMAQSAIDRSLINRYRFGNMVVALDEYYRSSYSKNISFPEWMDMKTVNE
jgi:hypothetical protein